MVGKSHQHKLEHDSFENFIMFTHVPGSTLFFVGSQFIALNYLVTYNICSTCLLYNGMVFLPQKFFRIFELEEDSCIKHFIVFDMAQGFVLEY